MKAIVVHPRVKDSIHMRDVPDPQPAPDQVAVRVIRCGLCGTDAEINEGAYGQAPPRFDYLILGHENFGVVEEVGKKAKGFRPGDYVVSTVRRPCGKCYNCLHGENDLCTSGLYTERGIKGRHGFMAQYYVELPEYLVKIPRALRDIGVLLEPTSVVEKGIDHSFRIQKRMQWKPRTALVFGAGPVGLLAAAVLALRGLRTIAVGREPENDPRAQLARKLGARYFSVANVPLADLPTRFGPLDLIVEATGSSAVVFSAMRLIAPDGILCLLSVTGGSKTEPVPTDEINQDLVLRNNVVFGSVNANPRHFRMGAQDFAAIEHRHPGALARLITDHLPWQDHKTWFTSRGNGIKTTLEISS
jgi:glucose 1-dehydrogenase